MLHIQQRKFKTTIELFSGDTITEDIDAMNSDEVLIYWEKYFIYWGKVQRMWQGAKILKVEEVI